MELFGTILVATSGVAWTIVYIELIRLGFDQKACGMPLFALTLNLAWEWIYGIDGLFVSHSFILAQSVANVAWACCDVLVMATWVLFGKKYMPDRAKRLFLPYTVLALAFGFAMQFAFYFNCESAEAASIYSAFAQNAAMSVMFLAQLFSHNDTKAQSMTIAVCKCVGTLAPTVYGQINGSPLAGYILITGLVCFVFDMAYIVLLRKQLSVEALDNS